VELPREGNKHAPPPTRTCNRERVNTDTLEDLCEGRENGRKLCHNMIQSSENANVLLSLSSE